MSEERSLVNPVTDQSTIGEIYRAKAGGGNVNRAKAGSGNSAMAGGGNVNRAKAGSGNSAMAGGGNVNRAKAGGGNVNRAKTGGNSAMAGGGSTNSTMAGGAAGSSARESADAEQKAARKRRVKNRSKETLKYMFIIIGLLILLVVGLAFIAYGLNLEPIKSEIDDHVLAGITSHFETTSDGAIGEDALASEGAITEGGVKAPITTPNKTSESALTGAAVTGGALSGGAVTGGALEEKTTEPPTEAGRVYSKLYPEMKVAAPAEKEVKTNVLFITFDDGPSQHTEEVLDILKDHDAHATFFLVGNQINDDTAPILKRMIKEGHTIGVHTTCHKYNTIYASVDAYVEDFHTTYQKIRDYTGTYPRIFRFPGGSNNNFNKSTRADIKAEMLHRGFTYYDWNISVGDATKGATEASVYSYAIRGLKYKDATKTNAIMLMHDTSSISVSQLDEILTAYENAGFTIEALNSSIKPVVF